MTTEIILIVISFCTATIDLIFGMGFGLTMTPILLLLYFEPHQIVPSLLLASLAGNILSPFSPISSRNEGRFTSIFSAPSTCQTEISTSYGTQLWKGYHVLILDEWMLVSLRESEARDLLEIIHSRHKRASTIFCSQFAPAGWHAKIGEATLADAILDRIVYDSYTIEIHCDGNEPSMREVYGIKE